MTELCVHCAFVLCALFNVNQVQYDGNAPSTHTHTHTNSYIFSCNTLQTHSFLFSPRRTTFSFALSRTFQSQKYYAMHSLYHHCIVSNSALGHLSFTTRANTPDSHKQQQYMHTKRTHNTIQPSYSHFSLAFRYRFTFSFIFFTFFSTHSHHLSFSSITCIVVLRVNTKNESIDATSRCRSK